MKGEKKKSWKGAKVCLPIQKNSRERDWEWVELVSEKDKVLTAKARKTITPAYCITTTN